MALSAGELRIGNYIFDWNNEYCNVYELHRDKLSSTINGYKVDNTFIRQFKPIPLTEEWLLKFGFVNIDDEIDFSEFMFNKFSIYGSGFDCQNPFYYEPQSNCNTIEVKYVHQLQNLYWCLTGEELKLNDL